MPVGIIESLVEALARRVADAFSVPLDALRETPPHTRSATDDARIRLDAWVKHRPVPYAVLAAAVGGAVAVVVPTNLGFWAIPVAAAVAGLAASAVPAAAFLYYWVSAPARQRDEARAALEKRQRVKKAQPRPLQAPRSYLQAQRVVEARRESRAQRLRNEIQDELVAIVDQGNALNKNAFDEAGYGPFKLWDERAATFIEEALGPLESQRFRERYDPPPQSFHETVEQRVRRVADLRDRPESWGPQIDSAGLRNACEVRRDVSQADLVVLSGDRGGAAQIPGRLDRSALAAEMRDLADALARGIEARGPAEQEEIAATESYSADLAPGTPSEPIRGLAESWAVSATRDGLLAEFGSTLDSLVGPAIELGAIPRIERDRYLRPEKDTFKSLPEALHRVADRLDSFRPPSDS